MSIVILDPARFNNDGGLGTRRFVRAAFNDEGWGSNTSFKEYRQGGSVIPAGIATFDTIGAATAGDPLGLKQFSNFTVPSAVVINNKSTSATASAYDSGSASASIIHYFYSNKTYEIVVSAEGFPDAGSVLSGDGGAQSNWLLSPATSSIVVADFSMKYTYTGIAPLVQIGATNFASVNTWYALSGSGTIASINLGVNQFGQGNDSESSTVTISVAKTDNLSKVLDTATLSMSVAAIVTPNENPS